MSNMSVKDVMAVRSAILERNAALRSVASAPASVLDAAAAGRPTFEAAMNTVLQKGGGPESLGQVRVGQVAPAAGPQDDFVSTLQGLVAKVNEVSAQAGRLTVAYERGEETDLAKVMLARQQASIGFEATLQVRNKVLAAYKDIMSMAV